VTMQPRKLALFALWLTAALGTSVVLAADKRPPPAQQASADRCAEVQGSVRLEAYGYTHVVTLKNGCTKPVECALWSNVDPEPRTVVRVAPGESAEIVTRRGSPARELVGMKSCSYR